MHRKFGGSIEKFKNYYHTDYKLFYANRDDFKVKNLINY